MLSGNELTTDADTLAQLLPQLQQLVSVLESRRAELSRRTSAATYERIRLQALMLVQHADVYSAGGFDVAKRNRYMAENVLALIAGRPSGTRAVLWAHNDHIAKTPTETGIYLRDALGDAYYALGFSFEQGTFQAREYTDAGLGDVRVWSVGAAPEGTLDWYLARPKLGNYIIDFRQEPVDVQVQEWLTTFQHFRMMGCIVSKQSGQNLSNPEHFPYIRLDKAFDGMAFIRDTTRARPNVSIHIGGRTPC